MSMPDVLSVRNMSIMIISTPRRVDMLVFYLVMMLIMKVIENVPVPSERIYQLDPTHQFLIRIMLPMRVLVK